jgi:hypothetical protein
MCPACPPPLWLNANCKTPQTECTTLFHHSHHLQVSEAVNELLIDEEDCDPSQMLFMHAYKMWLNALCQPPCRSTRRSTSC